MKIKALVLFLLAGIGAGACATSSPRYVHPTYDFSVVKKMAVLPMENLSTDQLAGEKVRKAVVSELLAAGVIDIIEIGQVNRTLNQQGIQNVTALSADDLKKLGTALGAQALVLGSVETFDRVNVGGVAFPEVSVTLRALDVATGTIVWSASQTGGGPGIAGRLFGMGGDTMTEATQKTVRGALRSLFH